MKRRKIQPFPPPKKKKTATKRQQQHTNFSLRLELLSPSSAVKQCRSSKGIPALLVFIVPVSFTGSPNSHTSLPTLLICILQAVKRWTSKKSKMALHVHGFYYELLTLHWIKTEMEMYNNITGIFFCSWYKLPILIKLYTEYFLCNHLWFFFFYCFWHIAEKTKIHQVAINVILSLGFEYFLQVSCG